MFTLPDTANAPPEMPLDNHEFTSSTSSLLEKTLQNEINTHILKKSLEMVTHQATPYGCPKHSVGSITLNRSGTLQESHNWPEKNSAPHWAPIVTQGCFLGQ